MKVLAENKKVRFNYELLEKFQAGLVLQGQEVKSMKIGRVDFSGSYVLPRNNEFYLVGCHVPAYQPKNAPQHAPEREKKLLLTKKELLYLLGRLSKKGLTLVPLKIYTGNNNRIKLEFALAKPIKKIDKRRVIKEKEIKREISEFLA